MIMSFSSKRRQRRASDLLQVALGGTHQVTPLPQTKFDERNGVVSRDGRWLAYESNRSGSFEIYVRPFPNGGSQEQVSTAGGTRPLWAANGKELFYVGADTSAELSLWQVPVQVSGASVERGRADEAVRWTLLQRRHLWPYVRRVARWSTVPDDQGGWDRRRPRAVRAHCRTTLGRGAEASGADKVTCARRPILNALAGLLPESRQVARNPRMGDPLSLRQTSELICCAGSRSTGRAGCRQARRASALVRQPARMGAAVATVRDLSKIDTGATEDEDETSQLGPPGSPA